MIRLSLTYVDEIILGYNIRLGSQNPFETATAGRGALCAERQHHGEERRLAGAHHVGAGDSWCSSSCSPLRPRILYWMPGALAGWSFVLAIILAWAVKSALIEPFCIAALMQVYFKVIAGQVPNPDWDRRLSEASK